MNRNNALLKYVDRDLIGLEIGPSHNPVASKREGFNVRVLDHLDQQGLAQKYEDDPSVDISRIEEVDYVWGGGSLVETTGGREQFSWIIASHVIEHVPDLVGFLNDCASLMTSGGVLALAVPDKRYCFDFFRPVTSLGAVVDSHLLKASSPTPGSVFDFFINYSRLNGHDGWGSNQVGTPELVFELQKAVEMMRKAEGGAYVDIHQWCFTPASLRLLLSDLNAIGLITLKEVDFINPPGSEFFIFLGCHGVGTSLSRKDLLCEIQREFSTPSFLTRVKTYFGAVKRKLCLATIVAHYHKINGRFSGAK